MIDIRVLMQLLGHWISFQMLDKNLKINFQVAGAETAMKVWCGGGQGGGGLTAYSSV